jgi:hypothetical protein
METKFVATLNNSLQYKKLKNFEWFSEWFECKILDVATNLLQWCTKGQDGLDHGSGGLMGKYFKVNQILKDFFKKRQNLHHGWKKPFKT